MSDPHRAAGCRWDGNPDQSQAGWFSLLDWAVYHAPGWQLWQEFRKSLIGQPMSLRAHRVAEWWSESQAGDLPDGEQLADAVRCVNVLRSLRGQFSTSPELPALLEKLNPELDRRWDRKKA